MVFLIRIQVASCETSSQWPKWFCLEKSGQNDGRRKIRYILIFESTNRCFVSSLRPSKILLSYLDALQHEPLFLGTFGCCLGLSESSQNPHASKHPPYWMPRQHPYGDCWMHNMRMLKKGCLAKKSKMVKRTVVHMNCSVLWDKHLFFWIIGHCLALSHLSQIPHASKYLSH